MRKNIYRWHRTLSLIIAIPVFLWAASGFMHPVMTNIKPHVATQWVKPSKIDTSQIKISLREALQKNGIAFISNVRIVQMGGNQFYQVQLVDQPVLQYISTQTGSMLRNGDNLYAMFLAKRFLEGPKEKKPGLLASLNHHNMLVSDQESQEAEHDCCANTTAAILYDSTGAFVNDVELVQQFTGEYKYINRLLPVYKVSFNRADRIRLYVETGQDRFSFAMDDKRAAFDKVFTLFHTLGWLDFMGKSKHIVAMALTLLAFITTLMGIYIFIITKTKIPNGNTVMKARRNHRWTSILISVFTLMFTFSGAFHAFTKIMPEKEVYASKQAFVAENVLPDLGRLQQAVGREIANISLVKKSNDMYWQVFPYSEETMSQAKMPPPLYVHATTYAVLPDGDRQYAQSLAGLYSGRAGGEIKNTSLVTKFTDEYGFVNKRLPVWKIGYANDNEERFYIETSTGKLAARIDNNDMLEGYSFALLHKHEFMAWAGKPVKDFSTMFWAVAQIAMIAVGLTLYVRLKRRSKPASVKATSS
jgi:hypothetical protein